MVPNSTVTDLAAMKKRLSPDPTADAESPMSGRILGAAFKAFAEKGYGGTSTLEIATRAKVSKRDLYQNFGSKQAVLVACIRNRTARMRLSPDLPVSQNRAMLAAALKGFGATLLNEVSHPSVIAMFRLAIAEATRSPEVAQTLQEAGRDASRQAMAALLAQAQSTGLIGAGDPAAMALQYLALLWEDLLVSLLLGRAVQPKTDEIERRAETATRAFLQLHPEPVPKPQ
jgi:AcrR family transcriptional regulator